MEKEQALDISINGALWIEKIIQDDGRIIYGYDCKTLKKDKGYNILRHAGSIWAMLGIYEIFPESSLLETATKSLQYIKDNFSGVVNGMEVIHEDGWIKLGGNGLVSMAMLRCYQMHVKAENNNPGCVSEDYSWLLNYGTSLVAYMYKCIDQETNLFTHHKRNLNTGADKGFNSLFYPGEALLAMATAYEMLQPCTEQFGSDEKLIKDDSLRFIQEIITAYFVLRESEGHVRDHWMIQAIEKVIPFSDCELTTTILLPYAESIKDITLSDSPSGSAGASAARSESLLAYVRLFQEYHKDSKNTDWPNIQELIKVIQNQLNFQASCYIRRGLSEGAFRAKPTSNECRCDCTQHNISSFVGYSQLPKD